MNLANKVTASRLVFAPAFFVIYLLPRFFPSVFAIEQAPSAISDVLFTNIFWLMIVVWVLFIVVEITDLLDGMIARKRGEISNFGKLFDPFADTLTQVTLFFCFVIDGILPPILFLAMLYREFSVLFVRNLMLKKGVAIGARMGGKIKTVFYITAAGLALLAASVQRLGLADELFRAITVAASVVFGISVLIAIISLFDYVSVYRKASGDSES